MSEPKHWVEQHIFKVFISCTLAFVAWVGSTAESRLHDRLVELESANIKLARVEAKLDALIVDVLDLKRRPYDHGRPGN